MSNDNDLYDICETSIIKYLPRWIKKKSLVDSILNSYIISRNNCSSKKCCFKKYNAYIIRIIEVGL